MNRTSETMKVLALSFSLFALASTASVKTPRFSLISERSANGVPTVAVTFPNGHYDTLVLSPFTDDSTYSTRNCRYSGYLLSEPEACLAITYEMCEDLLKQMSNRDVRRHRKECNNAKSIFRTNGKGTYKIKDLHETSSSGN